jgi:hypothetical protein
VRALIFAILLTISSPAAAEPRCEPVGDEVISFLRKKFERVLFDSESARFLDVCRAEGSPKMIAGATAICGEVNAKNRYGSYVGFKPFGLSTAHPNSYPVIVGVGTSHEAIRDRFLYCVYCLPTSDCSKFADPRANARKR